MGMPELARRWTRHQVLALPEDGNRYELLNGELLVTPSPRWRHQEALQLLNDRIRPYVKTHRLGWTMLSPADLDLESSQLLQPDLFVVRARAQKPREWSDTGIPLLVVEVLSPATALNDRNKKRRVYQAAGVEEYWIVDCAAELIERWRPGEERPEILTERLEWQPDRETSPLVVELPRYFRELAE
jgi:Uma2 family endonuclease